MEDSFERLNVSFIVRLWLDEVDSVTAGGGPLWRGSVTHAMSGRRSSFQGLDNLMTILQTHLDSMLEEE